MKISGPGPLVPASVRRANRPSGEAEEGFATHLPGEETQAAAVGAAARLAPTNNLLALQEIADATHSRRRAVRRGKDLLDRLDEIRHALLLGSIAPERLVSLARMLRDQRSTIDDPRLLAVLDEIELRAAVELAKLGH
ncbi:MAG TPA: flagellar assembly protein FliX [Candidatus Sulfotelmatobacter sp.]|nr:flagellar assembly protein FliX [Candidatus Sulfotelmatobacter sp.]